jgi:hypothetical protein
MRNDRSNIIVELTFKFAISIVKYCEELESKKKFVIAKQLLKSGTEQIEVISKVLSKILATSKTSNKIQKSFSN